jgi:hypothetical protein
MMQQLDHGWGEVHGYPLNAVNTNSADACFGKNKHRQNMDDQSIIPLTPHE